MTIPEGQQYFSTFNICILNEELSSIQNTSMELSPTTVLPCLVENIPEESVIKACNSVEALVRQKALKWNVEISFHKNFMCENEGSSSRFLSKMSSETELSTLCVPSNISKYVSISLSGLSKVSIDSCQNEIINGLLRDFENAPLLSLKRIPYIEGVESIDMPSIICNNKSQHHLSLLSSFATVHLESRIAYSKMLEKKGFKILTTDLSIEDTISMLVYSGSYHVGLQNSPFNNKDRAILLPSPLVLTDTDKLILVDKKSQKQENSLSKLSIELVKSSKKIKVFSKQFKFDPLDLFYTLNCSVTKSKLTDLLFRNGCVLRIPSSSHQVNSTSKNFNEIPICLYGESMEVIDEVYNEICILLCSISNQFEISQLCLKDYFSTQLNLCSMFESKNSKDHNPLQVSGWAMGTKDSIECLNNFPQSLPDQTYSILIKGSKRSIFKAILKFQPSFDKHHTGDYDSGVGFSNEISSLSTEFHSHLSQLQFFKYLPLSAILSFKIGTLSIDSEFISGKKDGKLLKISRITGCQLQMNHLLGWRTEIQITSQSLPFLMKAVDMLEGELPASLSFYVPDHHHKRIIGHGGKHIQKWMKTFGVYVKFSNNINNYSTISSPSLAFSYPPPPHHVIIESKMNNTKDFTLQRYVPNVLIRTPAKNSHALSKMKSAILELAIEEDRTLTVLTVFKDKLIPNFTLLTTLIPGLSICNSTTPSPIFYYVGLLRFIKNEVQPINSSQTIRDLPNIEVLSNISIITEMPDQSHLQSVIEQDLEASIESLVDEVFQADSYSSPLTSFQTPTIENSDINSKMFSFTNWKKPTTDTMISSKFTAISRPCNTNNSYTQLTQPMMPFKHARESYHWDSLLDRASISLGNGIPFSSDQILPSIRLV